MRCQTFPVSNAVWNSVRTWGVPHYWSQHARCKPPRPYMVDLAVAVVVGKVVFSSIVHTGFLFAFFGRNSCAFSEHRFRSRKPRAHSKACQKSPTSHGSRLLPFRACAVRGISIRLLYH